MSMFLSMLLTISGMTFLAYQISRELFHPTSIRKLVVEQIYQVGNRSFLLVIITSISTGMVMALQFGLGLEKFGGKLYVPKIVSLSIIREAGPVFASLMMAARVGAGIASEIASMVVTQQIDAIRALGSSPIRKIVIPRVLACIISLPILVTMGIFVGVAGGLVIGSTELNLDPHFYYEKILSTLYIGDYISGFFKSIFFSIFIAIPACYYGLKVSGGTKGVGVYTTKAVVISSILILVSDFFLTKIFWIIEKWV